MSFIITYSELGHDIKRQAAFTKLKCKGEGIFLLQKTHSCQQICQNLRKCGKKKKKSFFSHGGSNSRGTAILLSDGLEFKLMKQYSDNDGRYIIIDIENHNNIYTIVNIYAPTRDKESDQIRVFQSLIKYLQEFGNKNLIIGGDLNVYINPKLDKLDSMLITNDILNYRQEIESFQETEELLDIWRVINPDTRFYTWCRGNNNQSRPDYFYIGTFDKCIE